MKIVVKKSSGKDVCLRFPTSLLIGRLSATMIATKLRKQNADISGKQLYILFRAIKTYKAQHPEWILLEAENRDGETVEIII